MATERQSPDGIITQNNLSGALSAIQDDPDSPDANWWTAPNNNADSLGIVSFPTPIGNPTVGVDLQQFKIWIRKSPGQTGTPTVTVEVRDAGSTRLLFGARNVTSDSGQLESFLWNANALVSADGSGVEIYIYGTKSGGAPAARATVEVGAIEWNVTYSAGATQLLVGISNGIASVGGATKLSQKLVGAIACIASVTGATKLSQKIAGTIAGIASVSGASKITRKVAGAVTAVASLTSALTVVGAAVLLEAVVSGIASVSGAVGVIKKLVTSVTGVVTITGAVTLYQKLLSVVVGSSQLTSTMKIYKKLVSAVTGIATTTASLTILGAGVALAGIINGIALVTARLSYHRILRLLTQLSMSQDLRLTLGIYRKFNTITSLATELKLLSKITEK